MSRGHGRSSSSGVDAASAAAGGRPPRRLWVGRDQVVYELADDLVTADRPEPVYRDSQTGRVVVPTGRVLVRSPEGHAIAGERGELERRGYRLERVLSYAPHAAWVRSKTGTVGAALRELDRLRQMPGIEHVEPELIGEAARR